MPLRPVPLALSLALPLLLLAGCERGGEAPQDADPDATAAHSAPAQVDAQGVPPGEVDATRVVDRTPVAGAEGGFDVRAFAGAFDADGIRLDLAPDGTYAMATGAGELAGTWSVESDGTRIRLDPDSKDEDDRVYALLSADELASDDDGHVLRRAGD